MLARRFLFVCLLVPILSGCSSLKQDLGLGRNPPDEFIVVDRPPLSIPPDFSLRPPTPGAPRPQEVDLSQHASQALFAGGDNATSGVAVPPKEASEAEKSLLAQTGADKAPSDIRATINREASQKVATSDHLLQRLLWWKRDEKPGAVVDPAAETARLKEAKDKGQSPAATPTPIIEQGKSSWLGL